MPAAVRSAPSLASAAGAARAVAAVYAAAETRLLLPAGWRPEAWRSALSVACGLTSVAVRAGLAECGLGAGVVRDPARAARRLDSPGARLIGFSGSGGSAEVLDALEDARRRGIPAALVSARAAAAEVRVPEVPGPAALRALAFAAAVPRVLGHAPATPRVQGDPGVERLLERLLEGEALPIFSASRGSFQVAVLSALWREWMHRPCFCVAYPDWTHDLLWAMVRTPVPGAVFVLQPPREELGDRRFAQLTAWMRRHGHPFELLPAPRGAGVARLLDLAAAALAVAVHAGCDLETELHFDDDTSRKEP